MNNPISIDVNLEQYGRLSDSIIDDKKHLVQSLTIRGYYSCRLNDNYIKSMCNTVDKNGNRTGGRLSFLDFSKAQISERDGRRNRRCYDAFKTDSFKDCITLINIVLGELGDFYPSCLSGCISLKA